MEQLKEVYSNNKTLINLIGTNRDIQNIIRLTDYKGYCVNIQNVHETITHNEKRCIVSANDLQISIDKIRNSHLWEDIKQYLN